MEREQAYRAVRRAAAASGRTWSDAGGMFAAAASTPEGREAIAAYDAAVSRVAAALRGTRYQGADPEYV